MNITNLEITQAKLILPNYMDEVRTWIDGGVAREDKELAGKITAMVDALPVGDTMIHGGFHTGNVVQETITWTKSAYY